MIYLDHAAATPVSEKVLEKMRPFFVDEFFNPSSPYLPAAEVRKKYEEAKGVIANYVGAKSGDIVVTSGATEANSLAFTTVSGGLLERGANPRQNEASTSVKMPKILVLETEHASVLENAKSYKFDTIKVDKTGLIDLDDLKKKLVDSVELISVSIANNELGTIQPLSEISQLIREVKFDRLKRGISTQLLLHSDASQGLELIDINVSRLGVDLLTMNSAKVSGPKGVGALYVGHDVHLKPLIYGGGQEKNLRSGTENVAGVIGFATALEAIKGHSISSRKKYLHLSEIIKNELTSCVVEPVYHGNPKHSLTNFIALSFPGLDAERLIFKLEERGVYVSTGAACSASKGVPSHTLRAIGLSDEEIAGSLRLTLGVLNNEENAKEAGIIIREVVNEEYRRLNG